ncbi:6-hydroxymethylpterin diphosphokinase MptE-like protein [Marinospirillum perlucidum]|uniref:6-hydroxymethylpterin diphosphokinase MptE-like protein n=1 Tax=Marinospirillum perlucidum TaxID=1982602 RepID=UPI000DF1573C|nr:6-hydroxymethylpterin diphosphokinase MptE-like protein [Marinospirillum perlucidum]
MNFIEQSRLVYEKIVKESLNGYKGKFYVFGAECPAKIINRLNTTNCLGFTVSEPEETEIDGKPVLSTSSDEVQSADAIVLSSLSNQEGQKKFLESEGFKGSIIGIGNHPYLSTCMTYDPCDENIFQKIKNRHKDEPAVIIGNGPSLNNYNLHTIKRKIIKFACNGIFDISNIQFDYYFALDDLAAKLWGKKIKTSNAEKYFPANLDSKKWTKKVDTNLSLYPSCYRKKSNSTYFDLENNGIETSHTVALPMIQFAVHMGCNPIYLVGIDLDYSKEKKYATDDYAKDNTKIITKEFSNRLKIETNLGLKRVIKEAEDIGTKIIVSPSQNELIE